MRCCLRVILQVLGTIYLAFFRIALLLVGYHSVRIGNCRFWGPPDFITLAEGAMDLIRREDSGLFEMLRNDGGWFWYHPSKLVESGFTGTFSVTDSYKCFGVQGIAARLVWAHHKLMFFRGVLFLPSERQVMVGRQSQVKTLCRAWLANHQFPEKLIQTFS